MADRLNWRGTSRRSQNKKQCSRQLQCEVPCDVGIVINSSLFINSSLSSLSSTSHAVQGGVFQLQGGPTVRGGLGQGGLGEGEGEGEGGDISSTLPYILHHHVVLPPKKDFAQ